MTPIRNTFARSLLAASVAALLLSACGSSGDKPAATEPAAQAKPPAPAPFNVAICVNDDCGVIDQTASVLIPFKNDYQNFSPFLMKDTLLVQKDEQWQLLDAKTRQPIKTLSNDIYTVTPGYFGFERDGKIGLMDYQGKEVLAPRFDEVYEGGEHQYIGYQLGDKSGVLDIHGKQLTDALYDSMVVHEDLDTRGSLVTAERGKEQWVINLKDGAQKQVEYSSLSEINDGHMVAASPDFAHSGLVDANGALVVPMKYEWMGKPSEGLVGFRETSGQPCGYMDYTGKVVIEPRFIECGAFGKKGALAKLQLEGDHPDNKFGMIDRSGAWVVQPSYDAVGEAGRSLLGMFDYKQGYVSVFKEAGPLSYQTGIFDLNQGRELIPARYPQVGMLTPDRFVFSGSGAPLVSVSILGQVSQVPALGVMDATGKVLAQPEKYADIRLDSGGRYLRAHDGEEQPHEALLDLDGNQLIAPQWHELHIDTQRNIILGYDLRGTGDDAVRVMRAAYDLQGKPLFTVKHTDCGADQLVDGSGKVIWPQDVKPYCKAAEPQASAEG
ncbi:WG containing repeat-containing protein [Dyella sp. OK004]|uniref:WG repeat-containing protein n=1 Tax=Dyella sp. OK004 TaxID=1855292 RepID=UPI0008ECB8FD|nr:WG repeat-containing protein [Dyella sp. OK004]SFS18856.1 WG containing repeat-containing protein [Dyella sp. OK004]